MYVRMWKIKWDVYDILDTINNSQNLDFCYHYLVFILLFYYWKLDYSLDWDMVCCKLSNFINIQESPTWFWKTNEDAKANLLEEIYKSI